jgi:cytidine deaminase
MTDEELIAAARQARQAAYCPYSRFSVGAALRTRSGRLFTGVNVENASYGLTLCAERVAVGTAVAAGERDFEAIAIVLNGGGSPCGACRQVLYEFGPDLRVLMADEDGRLTGEGTSAGLLPGAFGQESL